MTITVYTKPACAQCDATKRLLTKLAIAYDLVDLSTDTEALEALKRRGYMQAPVVITDGSTWTGYRPDRIKALVS